MAPIATSDLKTSMPTPADPTVFPAPDSDERLRELWYMHGDPHSTKFSDPNLTSIAKLVEHNAATQPSQPAFIYPVKDTFSVLDWSQLHRLCRQAAAHYSRRFRKELETSNERRQQPTIALLGTGNAIDYLITQISLNYLHVRSLLLSNKNAPDNRDYLLRVCDAVAVITDKANEASLFGDTGCGSPVVELITLAELQQSGEVISEDFHVFETSDEWNLQSMIIHSSGSTGVPKPIIHTNRSLCQIARIYRRLPEYFIENWYLCFPLFHVAGLSTVLSGIPYGLPTTMPPEKWPPAPSSILAAWKALDSLGCPVDCTHCAPSVIDDLYEYINLTTKDFTPLVKLKVLQPGGAPLSPSMVTKLQAIGVNVKTTYGTTEIGPPMRTIPHTRENPDVYRFRNLYPDSSLVRMEPLGDGLFECVVYKGFPLAAELWLDDAAPNPYRTGDMFLEDPPASGYFVLQGRRDDILVHSNGEKTHASALAMALEEDKTSIIAKTAVYGTGKSCPSVVVEVDWPAVDDRGSSVDIENEVWQVVAVCNEKSAAFSKIPRELVLVLGRGETLPVTPKGNVRRKNAWELYGDRVENMYNKLFGDDPDLAIEGASNEAGSPTIETIQKAASEVLGLPVEEIDENRNWYELGLDSIQAVSLRTRLVKSFGSFPLMFILEYPTAKSLLGFLQRPRNDDLDTKAMVTTQHHEWIRSAINRLTQEMSGWAAQNTEHRGPASGGENVIYLTGASGSLGSALLGVLVRLPSVKKVYCAVRGRDPQEKVVRSLKSRGYSEDVWQSTKIHAVNYDMKDERLGLDPQTYENVEKEVTVVMHNAWKLDFNQPVQQFDEDCLRGTMHLMSFCLKGPEKTFAFMSSVAAAMGSKATGVIPERPLGPDPESALQTGYAQSKYIIEQITQNYASAFNVPVQILRVGQLSGHSRLGTWNHTEMWPIMMMTALDLLSAMPVLQTTVDWLPVDVCAEAIKEVVLSSRAGGSYTVTNLTNPSTTSWAGLLSCLEEASGRRLERIEMKEWVSRLEATAESSTSDGHDIPALKLLGFFQAMAEGGGNGEGVQFESSRVERGKGIDTNMVQKWLETWKQSGYLKM
ncbi:ochratoxin a non-ribosomal peptide synthetase [Colletotrichum kahawae]|uniref:Ochratoxin a non-ribosomal peptide synthetase n=1 Tax=Colletotrichum kahawae TaxID=34407 RepID=A0AAD9XWI4_COLKA|nr:ochratoxin a non-ribosomal peptide synthetase [Colletotrichum kahawae]